MEAIPTRRDDVVENFHGVQVADPYRWLEDPSSPESAAWVQAQNHATRTYLDAIPVRDELRGRLAELYNYPKVFAPTQVAGNYFYLKNEGLQNQPALYVRGGLTGTQRVLVDPNTFKADGTAALTNFSVSKDGKWLAYAVSESGSDWQQIRVLDVATGVEQSDVVRWCKFTSIAWHPDHSGFYYSRFPEEGTVPPEDSSNFCEVFFHRLGTQQTEDILVYGRPDRKEWGFHPQVTDDGKYLYLTITVGTDPRTRIYYKPLASDENFIPLLDDADALYHLLGNDGETFYFHTDAQAPRGRILAIDVGRPARADWRELVSERGEAIDSAMVIDSRFVVTYLKDAHHELKVFALDGRADADITLPTVGSVTDITGGRNDHEMFVAFTSYLYPQSVFRYDFQARSLAPFAGAEVSFPVQEYITRQVFYTAMDGTRVPMFLTHKQGITLDGSHPTLLYGYGGFNISMTPAFSPATLLWLERGGVYAVANLRGGNEYGEEWHRAGMLERKQTVFDDFHVAAEWLVESGYTTPKRLAIMGRSNGGLLVSASMLQRPELFGAVICGVPVIDMLRYHRFTVGRYWVPEYGNAEEDPEHFRFMYAYSPLHNVRQGRVYPPILITTADTDDRVVPMHAKKFTATMQAASPGVHPVLLRVEMSAGHGAGTPISKVIEEQADVYAFLLHTLTN